MARADVLKLACAPDAVALRTATPNTVVPSWKVMVPVGVAPPELVTVAVRTTD